MPEISELDLEDDEVIRRLMSDCGNRGISPSSIKHLRYLKRFLVKLERMCKFMKPKAATSVSIFTKPTIMKVA